MKNGIKFLLSISIILMMNTFAFSQMLNKAKIIEQKVKNIDNGSIQFTQESDVRHGIAPQVNNRDSDFVTSQIDMSKNGYGAYYKYTNPLAYGLDEGYLAVYRQWLGIDESSGNIGAAQSEDGEEWETEQSLNPHQVARYPSAAFTAGSKPIAVWNEIARELTGGGASAGFPQYTWDSQGLNPWASSWFATPQSMNPDCAGNVCTPNDIWRGNVMLTPRNGSYQLTGTYVSFTDGDNREFMMKSSSYANGYFNMSSPYVIADGDEMTSAGDSLWFTSGHITSLDYHINDDGLGYMVQVGWGNFTDIAGNDDFVDDVTNQSFYYKKTENWGDTWTYQGGFKNSGYHVMADAVARRLTDSLYTGWELENNEYYYHYGDTLTFEDDTLADGSDALYFLTPGWTLFYTSEMRTDANGGLHLIFPFIQNICKEDGGGCADADGDGEADSTFITWGLSSGIMHAYSPDPMADVDNWTASFVMDMSESYSADFSSSDIKTIFHDGEDDYLGTIQYLYPNITLSAEEGSETMYFAISAVSEFKDDMTDLPTDLDLFMAKSTDNGLTWSDPENVTNTRGSGTMTTNGYPESALEVGVHLATAANDESVGVFYQSPDFNVLTVPDNDGYEDYKQWVYVGLYTNDYLDINDENNIVSEKISLGQNYPNPFNPLTQIKYEIDTPGLVQLDLYDIRGNHVKSLVNENKPAGVSQFTLNGAELSSGVYFYTLVKGSHTATKKLVLLK